MSWKIPRVRTRPRSLLRSRLTTTATDVKLYILFMALAAVAAIVRAPYLGIKKHILLIYARDYYRNRLFAGHFAIDGLALASLA